MESKMLGIISHAIRAGIACLGCCVFAWVAPLCHGQMSAAPAAGQAVPAKRVRHRVKDITRLSSDRTNTLEGRGLVTGLGDGGSSSEDTAQELRN